MGSQKREAAILSWQWRTAWTEAIEWWKERMWGKTGPWIRGLNRKTGRDEPGSLLSQCRLYGNLPTFAFWRALSSERQQMVLVEIASTLVFFKWRLKWCHQKKTNVCFIKHLPDNIKVWFLSLFIVIIIFFQSHFVFSEAGKDKIQSLTDPCMDQLHTKCWS